MSAGAAIPWERAFSVAQRVSDAIAPLVVRAKCVGSVRRRKPLVGDIEFVVEPHLDRDMFGDVTPALDDLKREVLNWSEWVKGGDRYWQVRDIFGIEGLKLDLFICWPPAEWGSTVAIRTGPPSLSQWCVTQIRSRTGVGHEKGHCPGYPTPTEGDFFALAGIDTPPPHLRDRWRS